MPKTLLPRADQPVEQRRSGGGTAKVAPVGRALEAGRGFADERPRDHPADIQRIDQFAHDLAKLVEPIEAEMRLMRGDLDDGIGRGVADRLAGPDMLFAEPLDDFGAGRVAVAEDARHVSLVDDRFGQLGGEGRHGVREIAPVERHRHGGDLPVAGRRVLAARHFLRGAVEGGRTAALAVRAEPESGSPSSAPCASPSESMFGNVSGPWRSPSRSPAPAAQASAIWANVFDPASPKRRCIGRSADAEGIQNEQECAGHRQSGPWLPEDGSDIGSAVRYWQFGNAASS